MKILSRGSAIFWEIQSNKTSFEATKGHPSFRYYCDNGYPLLIGFCCMYVNFSILATHQNTLKPFSASHFNIFFCASSQTTIHVKQNRQKSECTELRCQFFIYKWDFCFINYALFHWMALELFRTHVHTHTQRRKHQIPNKQYHVRGSEMETAIHCL